MQLTSKAIVVYPNSGEVWDGRAKRWLVSCILYFSPSILNIFNFSPSEFVPRYDRNRLFNLLQPSKCFGDDKFELFAARWHNAGAQLIGGCCRTTPSTVRAISNALRGLTEASLDCYQL